MPSWMARASSITAARTMRLNAAGMVREKGAAGAVVEGAVPAVGGTAGQALEDGDPVTADAAEGLHDEGEDRVPLVHGVAVIPRGVLDVSADDLSADGT